VQALPELNVLLLWGTEEDIELLNELVQQLEQLGEQRAMTIRVVPLLHVRASRMAPLVDELYTAMINARGGATIVEQQARIIPLAKPNAILLAVPKTDVGQLAGLIRRLDQPVSPATQFRIFRLQHAAATDLAGIITDFFTNRDAEGELAQQLTVTTDPRSNSLIVAASPRDMAEVERLVRDLDVESAESILTLRVFALKNTLATEIASVLQQAISPPAAGQPVGTVLRLLKPDADRAAFVESGILENVRITANPRANTLVVAAPPKTMGLIEELIQQLDVPPALAGEIKVFTLENSDATRMARTLQSLFQQMQQVGAALTPAAEAGVPAAEAPGAALIGLTFSVDERTNSILVSGSPAQLAAVEAIILRLDGSEVLERTTTVYRLKNATAEEVAQALNQFIQNQLLQQIQQAGIVGLPQLREQNVVVVPEPVTNSLLISASPRVFPDIQKLIEQLDEPPPQVVIQVLIAEVALNENEEFGLELGIQDSILFRRGIFPGTASLQPPFAPLGVSIETNAPPGIPGFDFNNKPLPNNPFVAPGKVAGQALSDFMLGRRGQNGYGGLVISASSENISLLLRALKAQGRLTVLSRPQIQTVDNQEAFIQVGQQVPLVTSSVITTQGTIINPVDYQDVGIILLVLPKINPDGTVLMRVDPQVSDLSPERVQISEDTFAPVINTTRAETTISAMDGQTVIIGGLITNRTFKEVRKVPVLGDLPILKWAFRYEQEDCRKRELLILLTPHVVTNAEEAEMIKRIEAERIDWIMSDVEKIHGSIYGFPPARRTMPQQNEPMEQYQPGLPGQNQDSHLVPQPHEQAGAAPATGPAPLAASIPRAAAYPQLQGAGYQSARRPSAARGSNSDAQFAKPPDLQPAGQQTPPLSHRPDYVPNATVPAQQRVHGGEQGPVFPNSFDTTNPTTGQTNYDRQALNSGLSRTWPTARNSKPARITGKRRPAALPYPAEPHVKVTTTATPIVYPNRLPIGSGPVVYEGAPIGPAEHSLPADRAGQYARSLASNPLPAPQSAATDPSSGNISATFNSASNASNSARTSKGNGRRKGERLWKVLDVFRR